MPEGFDRRHAEAAAPPFDGTDMMTVPEIMTVGELLASLGQFQDDHLVRCNGDKLGALGSYRGYYDHLAFGSWSGDWAEGSEIETVGNLRAALHLVQGTSFEGYKGGTYTMHSETPVWVSDYGECSHLAVVGVSRGPDGVVSVLTREQTAW